MIQKYQTIPKSTFYNFCKSVEHEDKDCRTLEMMKEITYDAYRMKFEPMTSPHMKQYNNTQQFSTPPQYNNAQQYNQVPQYNTPHIDNQANRGGFRGGGHGGRGFGQGRGIVTFHNCHKPRHYARDCPHPPMTCMYYRAIDHDTEECPTLLTKIQEMRNQNNKNVQWIAT
jgi:hypothetical protein